MSRRILLLLHLPSSSFSSHGWWMNEWMKRFELIVSDGWRSASLWLLSPTQQQHCSCSTLSEINVEETSRCLISLHLNNFVDVNVNVKTDYWLLLLLGGAPPPRFTCDHVWFGGQMGWFMFSVVVVGGVVSWIITISVAFVLLVQIGGSSGHNGGPNNHARLASSSFSDGGDLARLNGHDHTSGSNWIWSSSSSGSSSRHVMWLWLIEVTRSFLLKNCSSCSCCWWWCVCVEAFHCYINSLSLSLSLCVRWSGWDEDGKWNAAFELNGVRWGLSGGLPFGGSLIDWLIEGPSIWLSPSWCCCCCWKTSEWTAACLWILLKNRRVINYLINDNI